MAALTKAQLALLTECGRAPVGVDERYRPGQKLIELGFVRPIRVKWGNARLEITEAGRSALVARSPEGGT